MKKKILLIVLFAITIIFCFGEKWRKEITTDEWGEENVSTWSTIAQTVNTSSGCKNLKASAVAYGIGPIGEYFGFCATFDDITPLAFSGYVEVKDGPKLNAFIYTSENMLVFMIIPLTLEQYRKEYEGKLVKLGWDGGEYITIKAPIWEE